MDSTKEWEDLARYVKRLLESAPTLEQVQAEYREKNAALISAQKKHIADMKAVCRIFEGSRNRG